MDPTRPTILRSKRLCGALALTALLTLAACGSSANKSSDSSSSGAGSVNATSSNSSNAGQSAVVAEAKSIVAAATTGLVGSKTPNDPLEPITAFNGPPAGTTAPRDIKVVAISTCVDPCQYAASFTKKLGAPLGWSFELKQSTDGTPQSFIQLTTAAIAEKPDVLLMVGVPDTIVQQQIQQAHAAGIKIIGESTTPHGTLRYDSYITTRQDISYRVLAYEAIAASNGTGHILWVYPSGFPDNEANTALAKKILDQCAGCKVTYKGVAIADMFSPTAVESFVTAELQSDTSLDYVIYVDDFAQIGSAQQAAIRLGRKIDFISGDASSQGLQFLKNNVISADPGLPIEWIGYATFDAIRRVTAGQPALGPNDWGGGTHLWLASGLPASLTSDAIADRMNTFVDYRSAYNSLWAQAK